MCGIIGVYLIKPTLDDIGVIEQLFIQSKVRGLHATGVSYVKNDRVVTIKEPIPADEFVKKYNFLDFINEDGNIYLIGHCRYSTSDIEYNQPISDNNVSIVHNGVITQELPEKWFDIYGYKCETRNDSELLLHSLSNDNSPLIEFINSSISVCELYSDKTLRFYRNGKRPLHYSSYGGGYIIASTKDIILRSNSGIYPISVENSVYYLIDEYNGISLFKVDVKSIDLQEICDVKK